MSTAAASTSRTATNSASNNLKVKTIVRLRPSLKSEQQDTGINIDQGSIAVVNPRDPSAWFRFNFHSVHGPDAGQEDIYRSDVEELVDHVWEGLTVTVFAYGVTSSGKTHTMQGTPTEPGIIPRVVDALFEKKEATDVINLTYMEIYRDEVYDLLVGGVTGPKLPVREDRDGKVVVANLTEMPLRSSTEFDKVFTKAIKSRSTGATNLNHASSRSHAILSLHIVRTIGNISTTGSINLVDLAGSENNKLTGNDPARMLESAAINKSLATLGQVVWALNGGASRIPYRDSKLTRILQDALGGSSIGLLICNLAPGAKFRTDTLNTLNFAARTREIENRPTVNEKDNRPVPKPHFAAVQPPRACLPARSVMPLPRRLSVSMAAPVVIPTPVTSFAPVASSSNKYRSRQSLLPVPGLGLGLGRAGRPSMAPGMKGPGMGMDESILRAEVERRVRQEMQKGVEKERQQRLDKEAQEWTQKERERELQRALEAERLVTEELRKQREKEIEVEREKLRKEQEEAWQRNQAEMDARIERVVEEQVAKRLAEIRAQEMEQQAAQAALLATYRSPEDGTPAEHLSSAATALYESHNVDTTPENDLKMRLEALEKRSQMRDSEEQKAMQLSPGGKKSAAKAHVMFARERQDKGDLEMALEFFKRAQVYIPDNEKLKVRIDAMELAIEKQKNGILPTSVPMSTGGSRKRSAAPRSQPPPAPLQFEGGDQNVDEAELAEADDRLDLALSEMQMRPSSRTRSKLKRDRAMTAPLEEIPPPPMPLPVLEEADEDAMEIDWEELPAKKKKRAVGKGKGKKGKGQTEYSDSDDDDDETEENDPKFTHTRRTSRMKGRNNRKARLSRI
ncbi:hypothetical protein FRB95_001093 [Tulasnella sp. JGI-2019a]|nr:hypothetical protein FRB95_001093 [Tulasnella sp. JGI-2019a]